MSTETPALESALEARQLAEAQLATIRAQTEAVALERTRTMLESPQPVTVPWSDYPAFDDFNRYPSARNRPYFWSSLEDRIEGRYLPLYETEQDLRTLRADGRRMHDLFPIAQSAIDTLSDYVIGDGWDFTCKPKVKGDANGMAIAAMLQPVVERLLDRNKFVGVLDREIHKESRVDGETFIGLYKDGDDVRFELVDPDCILQPAKPDPIHRMLGCSHKLNYWWHGVHTQYNALLKHDDVGRPLGYHAVFDRHGDQWDYLPSYRVEHIKRNVNRQSRRGVTDFAIILKDLEDEAKLRRNTAQGAAILAAIVMIRQHAEGVTRSTIEGMVSANSTYSRDKPTQTGSRTTYGESVQPGTVKDIPYGMTATTGPLGQLRSPVYVEVDQFLLRIIATRWRITEAMISGDASNNNRASMEVSEGGPMKARQHDQAYYANHFESLIWKALAMLDRMGRLPVPFQHATALVNINAEYSDPASRDKLQTAQANLILHDAGILSKRTWAADEGLDIDEETANGATEKVEPAPVMAPGMGGPMNESRVNALAEHAIRSLVKRANAG